MPTSVDARRTPHGVKLSQSISAEWGQGDGLNNIFAPKCNQTSGLEPRPGVLGQGTAN